MLSHYLVPSPLMGEGEDEGERLDLETSFVF